MPEMLRQPAVISQGFVSSLAELQLPAEHCTYVFEERTADSCQEGKGYQISEARCYGCGDVVWIDPNFPCSDDHANHHQT